MTPGWKDGGWVFENGGKEKGSIRTREDGFRLYPRLQMGRVRDPILFDPFRFNLMYLKKL